MNYINHYNIGMSEVTHKDKKLVTSLNSSFDNYVKQLNSYDFDTVEIPHGYEHRPDLISDLFYNTVKFDWLIMMFNNIKDPFQGLNVGDRILIPKI